MTALVVDTNVVLVANGQHCKVSVGCVAECVSRLQAIIDGGRLALDDGWLIIREYLRNGTDPNTGKRPGDAFVKWSLRNRTNTDRVDQVRLQKHPARCFESFPDDADLINFDRAGRKFVAVACAHPQKPPILQATDAKWLDWAGPLKRCGVTVEFICRDDIARFDAKRLKR